MKVFSKEIIYHFQCSNCEGWWTIGDFHIKKQDKLFCPWCGFVSKVKIIEGKNEQRS